MSSQRDRLARVSSSGEYEEEERILDARGLGHVVGVAVGAHPEGRLAVVVLLHPPHAGPCKAFPFDLSLELSEIDLEEIADCARDMHRATLS